MNSEYEQFPGNGLPPMPGVKIPAEDSETRNDGLEIIEAPGPVGEIIPLGDLIPEEGLPIPEFRSAESTEEPAAETEEGIEVEIVPEEELTTPEAEEDIRVEIVPEEELTAPEAEETTCAETAGEELPENPAPVAEEKNQKLEEKPEKEEEEQENYMAIGMCLGLSLGTAVGAAVNNVAIGMCIGLCLGMAVGAAIKKK